MLKIESNNFANSTPVSNGSLSLLLTIRIIWQLKMEKQGPSILNSGSVGLFVFFFFFNYELQHLQMVVINMTEPNSSWWWQVVQGLAAATSQEVQAGW